MALHDLPRKRLTYEDYVLFRTTGSVMRSSTESTT